MKGIGKAFIYFIMYFGLTMILQALLSIGFMAIGAANGLKEETLIVEYVNNNLLGITIISGLLTGLVMYLIFKIRKKQVKQEWKLNRCNIKEVALACVISFSFSFLLALVTYNVSIENSLMIKKSADFYSEIFPVLGIIMTAINLLIIAPVTEEIALRGIVYTRIEKGTTAITAIIVSAVLFGLMHFVAGGAILVIVATLMASVFGYLFYKFNSLYVCIIAHAVANLPDFILYNKPNLPSGIFWGLILFFAVLFIAGVCIVQKSGER